MRVGAYIDGLNLYYGGRSLCGRNSPGWRWLDLVALATHLVDRNPRWAAEGASVKRLVYCTSLVVSATDPEARRRQQAYLSALRTSGAMYIELGTFRSRTKRGVAVDGGHFEEIEYLEEKGSDVNVASHLLIDLHLNRIDAAILMTNDSDLRLPAAHARSRVPVGTVNPRGSYTVEELRGDRDEGPGGHWWYRLKADDLRSCQLPPEVGGITKPQGW